MGDGATPRGQRPRAAGWAAWWACWGRPGRWGQPRRRAWTRSPGIPAPGARRAPGFLRAVLAIAERPSPMCRLAWRSSHLRLPAKPQRARRPPCVGAWTLDPSARPQGRGSTRGAPGAPLGAPRATASPRAQGAGLGAQGSGPGLDALGARRSVDALGRREALGARRSARGASAQGDAVALGAEARGARREARGARREARGGWAQGSTHAARGAARHDRKTQGPRAPREECEPLAQGKGCPSAARSCGSMQKAIL